MKLSPKIYAQLLINSVQSDKLKVIAANFWKLLQKNKQYKDLPKILDLLDEEYAKLQNQVIAKVYSENKLTQTQEKEISAKLIKRYPSNKIIIKNIIRRNSGGITVMIGETIIDRSIANKITRLKQQLKN